MNTLSDPPLHVDHGDAIYLGIVRKIGWVWLLYRSTFIFEIHFFATQFLTSLKHWGL
jgi:hypothetical protein